MNAKELRILARRGSLQFAYNGESALIPEGVAYRVLLDPDDDPANPSASGPTNQKPVNPGKPFLLIAIVAAFSSIIQTPNYESPNKP